jgi:uncharacterized phage protein gp47/JayE
MPITATGFVPRTLAEIVEAIETSLREKISDKLDLSERTVLGNVTQIVAAHLVQIEDLAAAAYGAFDPDAADDDRLVALALLTGVPRRGATKGLVDATLNLAADFAGAAAGGLVAHVVDEPANRWVNRDAVPAGAAAALAAVFEAESAGAAGDAPASTLTIIAGPVTGWLTITNAADATPGTDIESIEALRLRRELAVAAGGSRTRNAIRAKLVQLDGVLSVEVFENVTSSVDADGIPPHAIRVIVWDGSTPAADDDEIAQAIYDHKAEGILSDGTESGTAQDEVLGPVVVNFERATEVPIEVEVDISSTDGVSIDDVKAAIIAQMPNRVGAAVVYNRLTQSVFDVEGVDDWTLFEVEGATADLPAVQSQIFTLDESDIVVTGDVS